MSRINHDEDCHDCSGRFASPSVYQTIDELEFERGIWNAALNGDVTDVEKHLDKIGNSDIRDKSGYTALHYASRSGHEDVCKLLLKRGANPNAPTRSGGVSPLHRAAYRGHEQIVKLLLKYGADPKIQDSDGKTALHKAVEGNHKNLIKIFVSEYPECVCIQDNRTKIPAEYVHPQDEEILNILSNQTLSSPSGVNDAT